MPKPITNINIEKINNLPNQNDSLSNITINNSIKIPQSSSSTNNKSENSNAGILIKDINSIDDGAFYRLNVDSSFSANGIPSLWFNNNEVIDTSNLLSELEQILQDHTFDISNLNASNIMLSGGYINFSNGSHPNTNEGDTGVGLRYSSNNIVQFKNYDTDWIDLVDITKHDQFKELIDVDIYTNPLINNQYITYKASNDKFVNSNLSIKNDSNPTLGGDLNIGDYLLRFSDEENRIVYNSGEPKCIIDNNLLVLKNNTTMTNDYSYIEIGNADITGDLNPYISAKTTNETLPVGITINTINAGNIELNAIQSNIYANAQNFIISNNLVIKNNLEVQSNVGVNNLTVGGYIQNSIYRTSTNIPYNPSTYWDVPITHDTILFNFNNSSTYGTYYANVNAGVDGQKLNLIFNSTNSNITVKIFFGTNKLIVGSGPADGLSFDTSGQGSSLMYLGDNINAWQALNTGAILF